MSLVSDPNIFTKDRLKEELQKRNITLPRSDAKKSVYVDLYKRELLDKREKLEFSSDDERDFSSSNQKTKNKTPVKKPTKLKVTPSRAMKGSLDVTSLSDADLREKLLGFGVTVGPIMESTRKPYQRKLEKLMVDAPKEPPVVNTVSAALADTLPVPDEFSDNEEEEPEPEPPRPKREPPRPKPEPPRPKPAVSKKSPARSERLEFKRSPLKPRVTRSYEASKDQVDYAPVTISNNATLLTRRYTVETNSVTDVKQPFTANNVVTQVSPPANEMKKPEPAAQKAAQKRRFPVWLQVALFIVLAIAIFLIIQNMEPAIMNPFKSQITAQ